MTPFTIKKLTEVSDRAAEHGLGAIGAARFANEDLAVEQTGVSLHTINPDTRQAFAHRHENVEEIYVVLSGSGRVKLDDDIVEITERDALRVSAGVIRQFEGGSEGIELLAFGPRDRSDGEILSDWWID